MKTLPLKLLLIALTCASTAAFAAQPTPSSIEAILSTNGAQQSLESTLAGVEGKMRQEINKAIFTHNNGPITPAQKLAVDKAAPQVTKVMQTEMGWDKMKLAYIKIYQDSLSQEEVNRLAALYKDPAYMALMQKMVAVNIKSAQAIQAKLPIIQQKIEPILEAAVKEAIGVK
ncbi:MAG: DUF2059 domain-containing protein [Methylococcales bacterium]